MRLRVMMLTGVDWPRAGNGNVLPSVGCDYSPSTRVGLRSFELRPLLGREVAGGNAVCFSVNLNEVELMAFSKGS